MDIETEEETIARMSKQCRENADYRDENATRETNRRQTPDSCGEKKEIKT